MDTVTIPRKLSRGDDLVVVRRSEFKVFKRWQNEIGNALSKVRRGRKEYKRGKTVTAFSPRVFR